MFSTVGFVFIWKLENFSFLHLLYKKEILSPIFTADNLDKTSWILRLKPAGYKEDINASNYLNQNYVFTLFKSSVTGAKHISLDYELSILSNVGSNSCSCAKSAKEDGFWFHENNAYGTPLTISHHEIFGKREILTKDTLTVQCKMWFHRSHSNLEPGFSLARTQIDVERKFFTWTIDNFSTLGAEDQKSASILMFSNREINLKLTLRISGGNVVIRVERSNKKGNCLLFLGISVENANGLKSEYDRENHYIIRKETEDSEFPAFLEREKLMEAKDSLLPGDKLSLKCGLKVFDVALNQIELSMFGANSTIVLKAALTSMNDLFSLGKRKRDSSSNSLTKDLRYLLEEKQHADVSLQVQDETFPVHKAVLAARSSVFKSMFDTNMKEKLTSTVEIDDIQPDTMRRLLLYIYSDTLDSDIQWENATSLYLAAEKYAVLGLKEECSSYFMANISTANACETLVLADMLSDNNLNNFVLNFIQDKDKIILNSDEWKHFAQTHPQLTIDILTRLYKNVKQF